MQVPLPLYAIGYDHQKLLSVADDDGKVVVPIFTRPDKAEAYRERIATENDLTLMVLVLEEPDKAINLFEVIALVDSDAERVVIDPTYGSSRVKSRKIWDFIRDLHQHHLNAGAGGLPGRSGKSQRTQKDRRLRSPKSAKTKGKPR